MSSSYRFIIQQGGKWVLLASDAPEANERRFDSSSELASFLIGDRSKQPLLLLLESSSCLFVVKESVDLSTLRTPRSKKFFVESELPWTAEESLIATRSHSMAAGATVCAVAAWRAEFDQVVQSVTAPVAITPLILLKLQSLVLAGDVARQCIVLLCGADATVDLLRLEDGAVQEWRVCDSLAQASRAAGYLLGCSPGLPVYIDDSLEEIPGIGSPQIRLAGVASFPNTSVSTFLKSKHSFWFDLARDPDCIRASAASNSRLVHRLVLALAGMLVVVALALAWRSIRLAAAEADLVAVQQKLFEETFPGKRVPSAILTRMRSEHRKVVGARAGATQVEMPAAAMPMLENVVSALMGASDFSVKEIRIGGADVLVDVELASLAEAGRLAANMEQQGFTVAPPSTNLQNSGKVRTMLRARAANEVAPTDGVTADLQGDQ